jgi:uncharacterized protein YbjT (DUF2867 family)
MGSELRCLITGATGYIGGHLIEPLYERGVDVHLAARTPSRLDRIPAGVTVHAADALNADAVRASLEGVSVAYYLVHTLGAGPRYAERDRQAATLFARAARDAGVKRIVYLGGLGEDVGELSEHLSSRQEVGRVLAAESGLHVMEFRASIVIGAGSTSFEMIRNLVEKLPIMTTPSWVRMPAQPIGIDDVVAYLTAAATHPDVAPRHDIFEIGGADIVSYGDIMTIYAEKRGLRRLVIPVPVLSPGLSGWWLYLFTPKQATVGRQLAESLKFPTTVSDDAARRTFPTIVPMGTREAMDRAFQAEDERYGSIRWAERLGDDVGAVTFATEGRFIDSRALLMDCPTEAAFDPIACIGGKRGWYAFDTLWDLRGAIDLLFGGPGHKRGRRDPYSLQEGDVLEWWRVQRIEPPRLLRLVAEMKLPGRGWLQYELADTEHGTTVRQTALFDAKGVLGRMYWYAVLPLHHFVFNGTLSGIERECRALVEGPATCPLPGEWSRRANERSERREGG